MKPSNSFKPKEQSFADKVEAEIEADAARVRARLRRELSAILTINEMIDEGEAGDPSRMIAAAESETTIACLVAALKGARDVIPLDCDSDHIKEIDAAIRLGNGAR